jgi:hypothetical protein
MRKSLTIIILTLFSFIGFAQVPPAFNYQAVARNNAGIALANQTMKVRLSVLQGNTTLYSETRNVTTNLLGLFNVQIGSVGALSTTGNISAINWGDSNLGWYSLKVELDLSNNNVFTDMGTQALTSVPFSLASEKSNSSNLLNGFPVDTLITPNIGSMLTWDGSTWKPTNTLDTTIFVSGSILVIQSTPVGITAPWTIVSNSSTTITVTGNETISASYVASLGNPSANPVTVSVCPVYELLPGGPITPFTPNFLDTSILQNPLKTTVSASAAIKLPAGTYRISLAIKNKSTSVNVGPNDNVNGVIQVR